jgi:hypothetical protein
MATGTAGFHAEWWNRFHGEKQGLIWGQQNKEASLLDLICISTWIFYAFAT